MKVVKDGAHRCYCARFLRIPRQSRATRKKCTTSRTRGLVLSPVSLEGSSYFLWIEKMRRFLQMRNNFYLLFLFTFVSSLKTEEVCACCYFGRMIDLTEPGTFHSQTGQFSKRQKLLLQDVTLGAWVLKNLLIGKGDQ